MNDYRGKHVVVVGLARTGLAAARFLLERGACVTVTDIKPLKAVQPFGDQLLDLASRLPGDLTLEMEGHSTSTLLAADLVVTSPGVPPNQPVIREALRSGVRIISEVELAYRHLRGHIIGITGSNGKTTTTTLIEHMFRQAGFKTFLAGNIGLPLIECVGQTDASTWSIVELSSFQLEGIDKFRSETAVLLNITPDHMDRYATFSDYVTAKTRLFANQTSQDFAVVNGKDRNIAPLIPNIRSQVRIFSSSLDHRPGLILDKGWIVYQGPEDPEPLMDTAEIPLKGLHNVENVMAALMVGLIQGIEKETLIQSVQSFRAVEHRLEWVGELEGITFYNDSKATNIDSCIKAIEAIDPPILLILGGRNKGGDFCDLKDLIAEKVKHVLAIGESVDQIAKCLESYTNVISCASMREAVELAFRNGAVGDTVLLAPACASFDMFKNYEHRGKVFKTEVLRLIKHPGLRSVH